jgi:hypothetical protein
MLDNDKTSVRCGKPEWYNVTMAAESGDANVSGRVHWSRIIHVADNCEPGSLYGIPRQKQVFNRLLDLRKICGSSAEMFYKAGMRDMYFKRDPRLTNRPLKTSDKTAMREALENMMNGLQRYVALEGIDPIAIGADVSDPTAFIERQLDLICIALGVPKRIFLGSERGELSSSQDAKAWEKRLQRRRQRIVTPRLISPFVDRLIAIGVLPEPGGYSVGWPTEDTLTDVEKSTMGKDRTTALAQYVQSGGDALVEPVDFLSRFLAFDEDDAREMIENRMAAIVSEERETAEVDGEESEDFGE